MKVKITSSVKDYKAGKVYEINDDEALELIEQHRAVEIKPREKKVKQYGNRQNHS